VRARVEDSRATGKGQRDESGGALGWQSAGRGTAQLGRGWQSALPLLQVEECATGQARGRRNPRSKRRNRRKVHDDWGVSGCYSLGHVQQCRRLLSIWYTQTAKQTVCTMIGLFGCLQDI
jgi:hypothetical protein